MENKNITFTEIELTLLKQIFFISKAGSSEQVIKSQKKSQTRPSFSRINPSELAFKLHP